jgi:Uma2 family endonuclease
MGTATYEDLLKKPQSTGLQVIRGMLVEEPSPTYGHQSTLQRILFCISRYLEKNPLGEVCISPLDVILEKHEIYQPDLIYIANENRSIIKDFIFGAPDLVVEILSPRTFKNDRGYKKSTYERNGVKEYWIVDPANSAVEIYTLKNDSYELFLVESRQGIISSSLLPGLSIPLHDIF